MNGLKEEFGDRMDFIDLNIDLPETLAARERFNIVQRSQYLVADPQGSIVQQWYGVLSQETVEEFITGYLAGT